MVEVAKPRFCQFGVRVEKTVKLVTYMFKLFKNMGSLGKSMNIKETRRRSIPMYVLTCIVSLKLLKVKRGTREGSKRNPSNESQVDPGCPALSAQQTTQLNYTVDHSSPPVPLPPHYGLA